MDEILDLYEWGDSEYFVDRLIRNWAAQITVDRSKLSDKMRWEIDTGRKDPEELPAELMEHRWVALLAVPGPGGLISGTEYPGEAQQVTSHQYQSEFIEVEDMPGEATVVVEPYVN